MWAFEVPADAYQLGRTRVFFKAGEISRVEAILKTNLNGPAGTNINDRMRLALERRKKALEAVLQVEALMAKAEPGVENAATVLNDVDDTARQINRDVASALELLAKAGAAATKETKDFNEAVTTLSKIKLDPRLSSLAGDGLTEEAITKADLVIKPLDSFCFFTQSRLTRSFSL